MKAARRWRRTKTRIRRRYLEARAGTVLVSFPKCGRTWLRLMIGEAIDAHFGLGATDPEKLELEQLGSKRRGVPRILVSHAVDHLADARTPSLRSTARYRRKQVILLVRDPRDAIVSLYFEATKRQRHRRQPYGGSISEFLREPRFSVATMLDYYTAWADGRDDPKRLLLVRYEDLHRDPVGQLRRTLRFVGVEDMTDGVLEAAVAATTFDRMRELERADALTSQRLRAGASGGEESFKTRRGKVGGYTDYLTPDDVTWLEAQIAELDAWYGYGAVDP